MPAQVLGILLVCYSSRGHQLVFAYPPATETSSDSISYVSVGNLSNPGAIEYNSNSLNSLTLDSNSSRHYISHRPSSPPQRLHLQPPNLINQRISSTNNKVGRSSKNNRDTSPHKNGNNSKGISSESIGINNNEHAQNNSTLDPPIRHRKYSIPFKPIYQNDTNVENSTGSKKLQSFSSRTTGSLFYMGKESFAGYDSYFLSDILSPKVALCDKEFRLTVDNMTFVGHPTLLHADRPGTGHRFARMIQRKRFPKVYDQSLNASNWSKKSSKKKSVPYINLDENHGDDLMTPDSYNNGSFFGGLTMDSNPKLDISLTNISLNNQEDTFIKCGNGLFNDNEGVPWVASANNMSGINSNNHVYLNHSENKVDVIIEDNKLDLSSHNKAKNLRNISNFEYESNNAYKDKIDIKLDDLNDSYIDSLTGQVANANQLTMFNIVFAVEPTQQDTFSDDVTNLYIHVISKLTAALKHEQLKRGFIRRETELILAIKEEAQAAYSKRMTQAEVIERIMQESSLANCLAHVYNCVRAGTVCHVVINSSVDLSLQVPEHLIKAKNQTRNFQSTLTQSEYTPVIRPYHALLLLYDPEEVLKFLPLDPTPLLIDLIRMVTPSYSFEELHTLLNCSLAQLYKLAAHLVHWRVAKIIDVVSVKNVYVLHPEARIDDRLINDFSDRYPQLPELTDTLAKLSMPSPFSSIIPRKEYRTLYLEVLTYLLRHNLVNQLHMYIFLLIPGSIKVIERENVQSIYRRSSSGFIIQDSMKNNDGNEKDGKDKNKNMKLKNENNSIIYEGDFSTVSDALYDQLSVEQQEWLEQISRKLAPSTMVSELFLRLAPYFMAKIHVEEILFRENLRRKDLKLILMSYKSILHTALLP